MEPFSPSLLEELSPSIMLEGTCGVYLLKNKKGEDVAVFKPMDEEYVPKEAEQNGALVKGHNSYRERAAFLVSDALGGYTGVPNTIITTVRHPTFKGGEKRGSLQRFVPASTDMSDLGPADIPVDEVHKIGLVDLLLFNVDRHEGNLLLRTRKSQGSDVLTRELVPIDHGLCLPVLVSRETGPSRNLMLDLYFAWESWPQAKQPFGAKARRFLQALSPKAVSRLVTVLKADLGNHAIPLPALTTLKVGALLLRLCAQGGKTLSEMAAMVRTPLADILQDAWSLASRTHQDVVIGVENANGVAQVVGDDDAQGVKREEEAGESGSRALVLREAEGEAEELTYEAWEQRLLAAFQVRLQEALGVVPSLSDLEASLDGFELDATLSPASASSAAASSSLDASLNSTGQEPSPIVRLDSPPLSPVLAADATPSEGFEELPALWHRQDLFAASARGGAFGEGEPERGGGVGSAWRVLPGRSERGCEGTALSCREEVGSDMEARLGGMQGHPPRSAA